MQLNNKVVFERLKALRERFPQCSIVALVDLSTEMILASSTRDKLTQEKLDYLCGRAVAILGDDHTPAGVECDAGGLRMFVRSGPVPEEALCISSTQPDDFLSLLQGARAFLTDMAEGADV